MLIHDPLHTELVSWATRPAPRLLLVEAAPGSAPRRRIARSALNVRWLRPPPGGGPGLAGALVEDLADPERGTGFGLDGGRDHSWSDLWSRWRTLPAEHPGRIWVLDARGGLPPAAWEELAAAWAGVRGQALSLRLMVLADDAGTSRLSELPHDRLTVTPPDAWSWAASLTGWSPADRVRAAAIFGSEDRFRTLVDPSRSLGRNVRSLVLAPDAPMATAALERVRAGVQRPERYLRAARAVSEGARDWGSIRTSVGGLTGSGQLGPYLRTLEERGVLRADRSLDAPPRSRSARYGTTDPWVGFWFSCVLPSWARLGVTDTRQLWRAEIRPRVDAHVDRALPSLLLEWLRTEGARARLGSIAREVGGLWGEGYDIPMAGTLETGAIVYGWTRWGRRRTPAGAFTAREVGETMDQLRTTRYGFGRENRLKLFVQRAPVGHDLARLAARDPETLILSIGDLIEGAPAPR